ncbi:MAG: NUDIX domain-containing protein [Acidimicrobiia bacterium]
MPVIRVVAVCVVLRDDEILVFEGRDAVEGRTFYRPLGGGVEFGERSAETIVREIREELGIDVRVGRDLGTLENVFTWQSEPRHEVLRVHEADFIDRGMYARDRFDLTEHGEKLQALWLPLADARNGLETLFPDGLLDLLAGSASTA